MTTIELTLKPGQGKTFRDVRAVEYEITGRGLTYYAYRTADDVWFSPCDRCGGAGGLSCFLHVDGGVCFQCGGKAVYRIASSEIGMRRIIRARISSRTSAKNAKEKRMEKEKNAAREQQEKHPNLATIMALARDEGPMSAPLPNMALRWADRPLTDKQIAFATELCRREAWILAHATSASEPTFVGRVGERSRIVGTVTSATFLPTGRPDRADAMLLILDATNVDDADVTDATVRIITSASWSFSVSVGQTLTLTGLVAKHHDHPSYGRQTHVSSPRIVR